MKPGGQLTLGSGSADNRWARHFSALREVIRGYSQQGRGGRTRPRGRQPDPGGAEGVCPLVQRRRSAERQGWLEQGAANGFSQAGSVGRRTRAPQPYTEDLLKLLKLAALAL